MAVREKNVNTGIVGAMLRGFREDLDIAQADIASVLEYQNANFISMLESGRSAIPIARVVDIANAYQLDSEMALVIVKKCHPDVWDLFTKLILQNKKVLNSNISALNKKLDAKFEKTKSKFGIS